MLNSPETLAALQQAAVALDAAQGHLAEVNLTIAGQLASYQAGPDFAPHPFIDDVQVRSWPTPEGAKYLVLEFRSQAGVKSPTIARPMASTLHVISGSVLVRRIDQDNKLELTEHGQHAHFAKDEQHGVTVLTATHSLVIYSK